MLNKLFISIITFIILSITSLRVSGQFFSTDQNPLSVNWRVINTSGFKLIYPEELETDAQRMANTVSKIFPLVGASLGRQKTSIPIVLQNRGVIANGFVQLAPKKAEFYSTPPQYFDSQDWLNNLAVHELRHVAQFDKITGGRRYPFPEEVYFAYMGAAVPTWFFEGDAVSIETALTNAGRGKQPSWIMPFRTQLLSGKKASYSKAYFGSLNDAAIGYYQLGYLLTSKIREKHGYGIFDSLLTDINQRPLRPYPFSASLKKRTGMGTRKWFLQTQDDILKAWARQDQKNAPVTYPVLNAPSRIETNYLMPVKFSEQSVLSLRQSKQRTSEFILTDLVEKKNRKLLKIGYQEQPWFSFANGKIVWDEVRTDKRFGQRSYSVVCIYDVNTGRLTQLTHRSRLFSPVLSRDGQKIAAVSVGLNNAFNLVELDAGTGKLLATYPNTQQLILQTPAYNEEGNQLAFIGLTEQGKSLNVLTIASGKTEQWIAPTSQQLSRPIFTGTGIAFNAHFNGIDNVYMIDATTKRIAALTHAKYGAFNFSASGNGNFLFNVYNENGYDVSEAELSAGIIGDNDFINFNAAVKAQENQRNVFDTIPQVHYPSKKYAALTGFFNVHSISPDVDADDHPGLLIKSNNLLNTVDAYAGAHFLSDQGRFQYSAGINFKALYPIFSTQYKNKPRQGYYVSQGALKQAEWREHYLSLTATVPFTFSAYQHNFGFALRAGTSYTLRYTTQNIPLITSVRFPLEYGFSFSHSVRTAPRDIAPKWAQYIDFNISDLSRKNYADGSLYAFSSNFYFPGLLKNHSFSAGFNHQKANGTYRFNIDIPVVYGYYQITSTAQLKNTLLLNYRFPIAFPDKELGPVAYIRNLRGGLFANYENLGTDSNLRQPKTFGLELRSNMNILRYLPVADVGGRLIFVNKKYQQHPIAELILNFNL